MTSLRVFEKTGLYVNFKSVNSSQSHVLLENQLSTLNANRNAENEIMFKYSQSDFKRRPLVCKNHRRKVSKPTNLNSTCVVLRVL